MWTEGSTDQTVRDLLTHQVINIELDPPDELSPADVKTPAWLCSSRQRKPTCLSDGELNRLEHNVDEQRQVFFTLPTERKSSCTANYRVHKSD